MGVEIPTQEILRLHRRAHDFSHSLANYVDADSGWIVFGRAIVDMRRVNGGQSFRCITEESCH